MVGNITNYESMDVFRVFLRVNGKKPRIKLSKELNLGEGSIKGILRQLKRKKLLASTKKGHFLTEEGITLRKKIIKEISAMKKVKLDFFEDGSALLVKNSKKKITYKERDIAIRNGAEAALLFKYSNKLFLPQAEQDLINTKKLDKLFDYSQGDVLIVVFAADINIVERALLNVAVSLNERLNSYVKTIHL